jgi:DNA-binding transcriptional LysR family regulator
MDRLASMTVFTRVVEVKSFTTAAKLLGISRAMASKHVQDLEHHLNIRLLNRTTRTLSLTDAGATFYDRCRQILESVQTAEEEAASQSLTATGKLRVAAPMSFGVGYVSPLIPSFLERHPDVRVDLVLNDRIVDLIDEGFDLAIRIGKLRDSSLIAR